MKTKTKLFSIKGVPGFGTNSEPTRSRIVMNCTPYGVQFRKLSGKDPLGTDLFSFLMRDKSVRKGIVKTMPHVRGKWAFSSRIGQSGCWEIYAHEIIDGLSVRKIFLWGETCAEKVCVAELSFRNLCLLLLALERIEGVKEYEEIFKTPRKKIKTSGKYLKVHFMDFQIDLDENEAYWPQSSAFLRQ